MRELGLCVEMKLRTKTIDGIGCTGVGVLCHDRSEYVRTWAAAAVGRAALPAKSVRPASCSLLAWYASPPLISTMQHSNARGNKERESEHEKGVCVR